MADTLSVLADWLARPALHLCVDAQRLFGPRGPWHVPWLSRVLPAIAHLARHAPAHTLFTRFIPPREPEQAPGAWADLYRARADLTRARLDPALLELLDPLAQLVPPARVLDKSGYSPFHGTRLGDELMAGGIETLIVSGTETDVCVAAAVLHGVDLGLRVIVVEDGVCSSSDLTHGALMAAYHTRLRHQVHVAAAKRIAALWTPIPPVAGA
jgi:nicotinamidase-related amidase